MPATPTQRAVVGILGVAAICFVVGAVVLWRLMPAGAAGSAPDAGWSYVAPEELPSVLPAAELPEITVAVVEEPENVQVTADGFYAAELARWRSWLAEAGARAVAPEEADVLVLPHAACLGVASRRLIARQLARGGGLVTTGPLGAYDAVCDPQPDTVLVELLGRMDGKAPFSRPAVPSPHAVILGESVFGARIPPGTRFEISPMHRLVFRDPGRSIFYSDFNRSPAAQEGEPFYDAAVTRARIGEGRLVAFGFGIGEAAPGWSESVLRLVVANAVTWAAGRPVLQLAPWPHGYRAAALIAQDVEADFANATNAVEVIERHQLPTTYFLVAQLAKNNRFVTRRMVATGEIASHSYHHRAMDTFSPEGERGELRLALRETQDLADEPVIGFRPPQERYTLETLRAWADLGGEYVFAYNNLRSAGPEILDFDGDTLVFFGRVVDDDFEILSRSQMRDRGEMVRLMIRQIDETIQLRGSYLFSYHSHMFAQEPLIPVLEALVQAVKARPELWVAEGRELARWWRERAAVSVVAGTGSAELRNAGDEPFERGVLLVDLPDGEQRRIRLPTVPAGESVRVAIPGT